MSKNILMSETDNVATSLQELVVGDKVEVIKGQFYKEIKISETIPFGHKFSITDISEGSEILKYGEIIGKATKDIQKGSHVHIHNVDSVRGRSTDNEENLNN